MSTNGPEERDQARSTGPRKLEPKKRAFFLHTQVMRLQIEHPGIAVVAVKNIKQLLQPMAVFFIPSAESELDHPQPSRPCQACDQPFTVAEKGKYLAEAARQSDWELRRP